MHHLCKKLPLFIIPAIMLTGLLFSSCKKNNDLSFVNTFLTGNGTWQLASLQMATYNGDTLKRTDTLNTACALQQSVNFSSGGTCTYNNFHCIAQAPTGSWTITDLDSVIIRSNIVCKDTTKAGSQRPFTYTQVVNLGQNSMVFEVVKRDTLRLRPLLVRRRVTRYGFIH